jgi:hypothetical protein
LSKPARVETFGFNVAILIDRDGNVIAGHAVGSSPLANWA